MKRTSLFLIVAFFASLCTNARASNSKLAVIEVQCDSTANATMYLTRFRGAGLEFATVDSASSDDQHWYRFFVLPDSRKIYGLRLGREEIIDPLFLAPGDSLIFTFKPSKGGDSLLFDLMGANRNYRNSPKPWHREGQYYRNLDSLDWDGWRAYLASFRNSLDAQAAILTRDFPTHSGLQAKFRSEAIEAYYYGLMYYLSRNYWDSIGRPLMKDPNQLRILDSIPWTLSLLSHSQQLYPLANIWPYLSWLQWYYAGIDTAGKKRFIKTFDFVHQLPPPARDVAELIAFSQATYSATPTELVPYMKQELKTYRGLASDTAYLGEFERKFAALSARLPGKFAPNLELPDTLGRTHTLAEFRGKITYLDFWGTWCGPCIGELPDLLKLEKSFAGDTNVAFVSIALQSTEFADQSPAGWRKFISERGLGGIHLYADRQFQNPAAKAYNIYALPTFMLINRDGTFIDAAAPRPSSGKAEAAIRAALAGNGE